MYNVSVYCYKSFKLFLVSLRIVFSEENTIEPQRQIGFFGYVRPKKIQIAGTSESSLGSFWIANNTIFFLCGQRRLIRLLNVRLISAQTSIFFHIAAQLSVI